MESGRDDHRCQVLLTCYKKEGIILPLKIFPSMQYSVLLVIKLKAAEVKTPLSDVPSFCPKTAFD